MYGGWPGGAPGTGRASRERPRAREPIFCKTHTNGILRDAVFRPTARRSVPATAPRSVGIREEGKAAALWGGCPGILGTSPRRPSQAAVGPCSSFAAFAWCPTVCRGTDDSGRAPPQHRNRRPALAPGALFGIWEDSFRRKGIPHMRRGVGSVGDWRFARPCSLATGGTNRLGKPLR